MLSPSATPGRKGAQQLTTEQRTAFANDSLNLQSTDGPTNIKKGDGDAATWLPPNKGFRWRSKTGKPYGLCTCFRRTHALARHVASAVLGVSPNLCRAPLTSSQGPQL